MKFACSAGTIITGNLYSNYEQSAKTIESGVSAADDETASFGCIDKIISITLVDSFI